MYYIINKVLFNKENDLKEKQVTCETLKFFFNKADALEFISNLKKLSVFCDEILLSNMILSKQLDNKDVDGYHLVIDDENSQKFNIYHKYTQLDRGYIYNSVSINIDYLGFIEISELNSNVKKPLTKKRNKQPSSIQPIKKAKTDVDLSENHKYLELNDKLIQELKKKLDMLSCKKNN